LLSKATYICETYNVYTHFTFTLMAHCTSGAIRGSVSCSRTLRQGIELATLCFLNDFFTSCTTVAPVAVAVLELDKTVQTVVENIEELKPEQEQCVYLFINGKDIVYLLPVELG